MWLMRLSISLQVGSVSTSFSLGADCGGRISNPLEREGCKGVPGSYLRRDLVAPSSGLVAQVNS